MIFRESQILVEQGHRNAEILSAQVEPAVCQPRKSKNPVAPKPIFTIEYYCHIYYPPGHAALVAAGSNQRHTTIVGIQ